MKITKPLLITVILTLFTLGSLIVIISSQIINTTNKPANNQSAVLKTTEGDIFLEIADSQAEQIEGLMNRTFLDKNAGMLFKFDTLEPRTFWMKNTLIPLDIIFLDENLNVVKVYTNTKTNQISEVYYSVFPSKFAIELNAGSLERLKIKEKDTLNISF